MKKTSLIVIGEVFCVTLIFTCWTPHGDFL